MLSFHEKVRLSNALSYLRNNDEISSETQNEVSTLINERKAILTDYTEEFDKLSDSVHSEGKQLREDILEKGEEMREIYGN